MSVKHGGGHRARSGAAAGVGDDRRDVLEVGQVLSVEAIARQRQPEGHRADEQADDGDAEGDAQVLAERRGVAIGQAGERGRERDEGPHKAQRRAGAHQHPRSRQAPLGVEVEIGQRLVELMIAAVGARLLDDERQGPRHRRAARQVAHGGLGGGDVASSQSQAGRVGARRQRGEVAPAAPVDLHSIAPELIDDHGERQQGQDENRDLQDVGDMKDRVVDGVGAEGVDHGQRTMVSEPELSVAAVAEPPAVTAAQFAPGAQGQE